MMMHSFIYTSKFWHILEDNLYNWSEGEEASFTQYEEQIGHKYRFYHILYQLPPCICVRTSIQWISSRRKTRWKIVEEVDECHYNAIMLNWYNDIYRGIIIYVSSFLFLMSWSRFCEYCWDAGVHATSFTETGQTQMPIISNLARAETANFFQKKCCITVMEGDQGEEKMLFYFKLCN